MSDPSFLIELIKMGLVLIFVVGLMFGLSILLRKLNAGSLATTAQAGAAVTPIKQIDSRRRLIEVQWRGTTTLMLLGPQHDIVVAQQTDAGNNQSNE